jgi:pullulanase/glycogen debranching enzyme
VFSKNATLIELLLFDDANDAKPARVIPLDSNVHRTQATYVAQPRSVVVLALALPAATDRDVGQARWS